MTLAGIVDWHVDSTRAVLEQVRKTLPQIIQQYLNEAAKIPSVTAIYLRVSGLNVHLAVVLADYDVTHLRGINDLEATLLEMHPDFCVTSERVYSEGKSLEQLEQEGAIPLAFDYDVDVSPPFERIHPLNQ